MTLQQYGTVGLIDRILLRLKLKRGYVPLNMTMRLAYELKCQGMTR